MSSEIEIFLWTTVKKNSMKKKHLFLSRRYLGHHETYEATVYIIMNANIRVFIAVDNYEPGRCASLVFHDIGIINKSVVLFCIFSSPTLSQ